MERKNIHKKHNYIDIVAEYLCICNIKIIYHPSQLCIFVN